jgi:hypothetical protein
MKAFYVPKLGLGLVLLSTSLFAFANSVQVVNQSPDKKPIKMEYQIAHFNPGEAPVYSASQSASITSMQTFHFDRQNYQFAAFVPVALNGKKLPPVQIQPKNNHACLLLTDAKHTDGKLEISLVMQEDGHGILSCRTSGAV